MFQDLTPSRGGWCWGSQRSCRRHFPSARAPREQSVKPSLQQGFNGPFIRLSKGSASSSRFAGSLCVSTQAPGSARWADWLGLLCSGAGDTSGTSGTVRGLCTSLAEFKQRLEEKHDAQDSFWHTAVQKCWEAGEKLWLRWM